MKKIKNPIVLLCVVLSAITTLTSQTVPQSVNFQGVARENGIIKKQQTVRIRLQFRTGHIAGPLQYCEINFAKTNDLGVFNFQLNRGNASSSCLGSTNQFSQIDWSQKNIKVLIEMEDANSNFVFIDSMPLASNFYALLAQEALAVKGINITNAKSNDVLTYNNTTKIFEPKPLPVDNDKDSLNERDSIKYINGSMAVFSGKRSTSAIVPTSEYAFTETSTGMSSTGTGWTNTNMQVTAPSDGTYLISTRLMAWGFGTNGAYARIRNVTSNTILDKWFIADGFSSTNGNVSVLTIKTLKKGDILNVEIQNPSGGNIGIHHQDGIDNLLIFKLK